MNHDCKIIAFAKAPEPGKVKTRLARVIGDERAAKLAARMLIDTVERAVQADVGAVELCCAPNSDHPAFSHLQRQFGVTLTQQGDGDLGQRMHRAFDRTLHDHARVVLIGTDSPQLSSEDLRHAARMLGIQPVVFAPAFDGGYVLIGLTRVLPTLFEGIDWSTDRVMTQTRDRLAVLDIAAIDMPTFNDIDEAEDLVHVPAGWLA